MMSALTPFLPRSVTPLVAVGTSAATFIACMVVYRTTAQAALSTTALVVSAAAAGHPHWALDLVAQVVAAVLITRSSEAPSFEYRTSLVGHAVLPTSATAPGPPGWVDGPDAVATLCVLAAVLRRHGLGYTDVPAPLPRRWSVVRSGGGEAADAPFTRVVRTACGLCDGLQNACATALREQEDAVREIPGVGPLLGWLVGLLATQLGGAVNVVLGFLVGGPLKRLDTFLQQDLPLGMSWPARACRALRLAQWELVGVFLWSVAACGALHTAGYLSDLGVVGVAKLAAQCAAWQVGLTISSPLVRADVAVSAPVSSGDLLAAATTCAPGTLLQYVLEYPMAVTTRPGWGVASTSGPPAVVPPSWNTKGGAVQRPAQDDVGLAASQAGYVTAATVAVRVWQRRITDANVLLQSALLPLVAEGRAAPPASSPGYERSVPTLDASLLTLRRCVLSGLPAPVLTRVLEGVREGERHLPTWDGFVLPSPTILGDAVRRKAGWSIPRAGGGDDDLSDLSVVTSVSSVPPDAKAVSGAAWAQLVWALTAHVDAATLTMLAGAEAGEVKRLEHQLLGRRWSLALHAAAPQAVPRVSLAQLVGAGGPPPPADAAAAGNACALLLFPSAQPAVLTRALGASYLGGTSAGAAPLPPPLAGSVVPRGAPGESRVGSVVGLVRQAVRAGVHLALQTARDVADACVLPLRPNALYTLVRVRLGGTGELTAEEGVARMLQDAPDVVGAAHLAVALQLKATAAEDRATMAMLAYALASCLAASAALSIGPLYSGAGAAGGEGGDGLAASFARTAIAVSQIAHAHTGGGLRAAPELQHVLLQSSKSPLRHGADGSEQADAARVVAVPSHLGPAHAALQAGLVTALRTLLRGGASLPGSPAEVRAVIDAAPSTVVRVVLRMCDGGGGGGGGGRGAR